MDIIKKHSDFTMADYTPEDSQTAVEQTLDFMEAFNEARATGFSVEESRKRTLRFVDDLWHQ